MHREHAQELYQQLTRDLTQGQLLQLSPRQSFTQQASFVLLKGHLVVKGQTEGMLSATTAMPGCLALLPDARVCCLQSVGRPVL